jgi:GNAT superfamily N-acetyltransferase
VFSALVLSHWIPESVGSSPESGAGVSVDPALPANRSVSLLRVDNGAVVLSLAPARASALGFTDGERVDGEEVVARIKGSGISLNDPDHLFYLTLPDQVALRDEALGADTRQLTSADAALFEEFTGEAPVDDLDEAFVELDHWLVFGTFIGDKLVCAASMYPWSGTQLADLGVITLPEFRGRGLGRATVRSLSAEALRRGYEPQYRCQLDNAASVALARAAGFTHFGEWEVIDTDE